jgi:hypothetical protein
MEEYLQSYKTYTKKVVYKFSVGYGGIGDCIKFFMHTLDLCIEQKYRLYYQVMNIPLEKYLRLLDQSMYIQEEEIGPCVNLEVNEPLIVNEGICTVCTPFTLYGRYNTEIKYPVNKIFTFSQSIWYRKKEIFDLQEKYISIHLRLGDKYLETDQSFVVVKDDERPFNGEALYKWIHENRNQNLVFFCDNNTFKNYIKEKFPYIHITTGTIGHSSLLNTSEQQIMDAVTEFFIITQSERIVVNGYSGFSNVAAHFNCIPITWLNK